MGNEITRFRGSIDRVFLKTTFFSPSLMQLFLHFRIGIFVSDSIVRRIFKFLGYSSTKRWIFLRSFFYSYHPYISGSLTEQLFESWETLSISAAIRQHFLKRCPQSSLIVSANGPLIRILDPPILQGQDLLPPRLETFLHELPPFIGTDIAGGTP